MHAYIHKNVPFRAQQLVTALGKCVKGTHLYPHYLQRLHNSTIKVYITTLRVHIATLR